MCDSIANGGPLYSPTIIVNPSPPSSIIVASNILSTTGNIISDNIVANSAFFNTCTVTSSMNIIGAFSASYFIGGGNALSNINTFIQPLSNLVVSNTVTSANILATTINATTLNISSLFLPGLTNGVVLAARSVTGNTQSNITSVGTLTGLTVYGSVLSNAVSIGSNIGNVLSTNVITLSNTGTINASTMNLTSYLFVNGVQITGSSAVAGAVTGNTQSNITSVGTLTGLMVYGTVLSNAVSIGSNIGNVLSTNVIILSNTGNIYASNSIQTTNIYSAGFTSNASITSFNYDTLIIPFINCTTLNVASVGTLSSLAVTGPLVAMGNALSNNQSITAGAVTGAAQTNITSVGILTGLTVYGTVLSNAVSIGSNIGNVLSTNVITLSNTGTINASTMNLTSSLFVNGVQITSSGGSSAVAGAVTGAAQTNITSVGTLTGLTVYGTVLSNAVSIGSNIGNVLSTNVITLSNTGNIYASNSIQTTNVYANNLSISSLTVPNSQPTPGYVLVTNGTTVYWAQNYNLIFTGTGTTSGSTRQLSGYIENDIFYAVTNSVISGNKFIITIAPFIPSFSYTISPSSPNWNDSIASFSITVTNTPGISVKYISQVYSINSATIGNVDKNFGNYTFSSNDNTATNTKPNVHSIQDTPWTDTFTNPGCIKTSGTGTNGGTAQFTVSFQQYNSGYYSLWTPDLTISAPTWASITASTSYASIPNLTFLQNFKNVSYTNNWSGYTGTPSIDNRIGNGGDGTLVSSNIALSYPYIYKDRSVTLNLYSNITFTRPQNVTGTLYTQNINYYDNRTISPTYTYPFFLTQNVEQHVITTKNEIVRGTSWEANDSVLVNASLNLPGSSSVTGTSPNKELYIGFSRLNIGSSNVIIRDALNNLIPPDYANTITISPIGTDVPGSYTGVKYVYYRFYIPTDQTISIYQSSTAPFDGSPSVSINSVILNTFLSNVSNTTFSTSYNGSFPATLNPSLSLDTTNGTLYSNAIVGATNSGNVIFANNTFHKNSNYTIKLNLTGNFYTADTVQVQAISQSATLGPRTVTSWPTFWTQTAKNPSKFLSANVILNSWLNNPSLANTNTGLTSSISFNNGTYPELFVGYSANNIGTFTTSDTFIQVSSGGATLTPAPYIQNDESAIDGTVNLIPVGAPSDFLKEQYRYFRYYISGSNPTLSLSTFTGTFDGSSYAYVDQVSLTTFLSNVVSTNYRVYYTGRFGGTMSITRNFQGSSVDSATGNVVSGTHFFPSNTMHKNSTYVSNIALSTTFIRPGYSSTQVSQSIGGSNVFTPTVTLYPTFYIQKAAGGTLTSSDVVVNTWLSNPTLTGASSVPGLPADGTISSGTSGSSPEFFFGYSRKSSIGYSNLVVAISGVNQTPDYSSVVNLIPNGAPSDFSPEPYVYYRYYIPTNSSLTFSSTSGAGDLTSSTSPTLAIASVNLVNILRYSNSTTFTIGYNGKFSATIDAGTATYPTSNGTLAITGTTGNVTSGTLTWPLGAPLYNQNSYTLGFSVSATYKTPEGGGAIYTPAPTKNSSVFTPSVNYPIFSTQNTPGHTLVRSDVVTQGSSYTNNDGDFINSNTLPITSNIVTPSTTGNEIYVGYSRTSFNQDIHARQNSVDLTPDYAGVIALSPNGAPSGWTPTNYVYWRYLVTSTSPITFTPISFGSTPTGTPSLQITQPVTSNNFLNWVSSTVYTATYSGLWYGAMSIVNNGQGTLNGTLSGTSNTGTLNFGFKLHNSNSFNLNILMNTQFQNPDTFGDLIKSYPTGWSNSATATYTTVYPTIWVTGDSLSSSPLSTNIVTGLYSDNSANLIATNTTGTQIASGFSNDLFTQGDSGTHVVSFTISSYPTGRMFYYCWSTKNASYNPAKSTPNIWFRSVGSAYWGAVTTTASGTVIIKTTDSPVSGGGSETYNFVGLPLGGGGNGVDVQIFWS